MSLLPEGWSDGGGRTQLSGRDGDDGPRSRAVFGGEGEPGHRHDSYVSHALHGKPVIPETAVRAVQGVVPVMKPAILSATTTVGSAGVARGMSGNTDASATRSPVTPNTLP